MRVMCDPKYIAEDAFKTTHITFEDVYAGICEQKEAVLKFIRMQSIRETILEQISGTSLPGLHTGQVHATGGGGAVQGGKGGG